MNPVPIGCPKCGTAWTVSDVNRNTPLPCSTCRTPVEVHLFPALNRARSAPAPTVHSRSSPHAQALPGEAVCTLHPARRAVTACDECGRLICGLCDVPLGNRHLCPPCFEASHRGTTPTSTYPLSRILHGRIAFALACVPLFPPTAIAALGWAWWHAQHPGSLVRPGHGWRFAAMILAGIQLAAFTLLLLSL